MNSRASRVLVIAVAGLVLLAVIAAVVSAVRPVQQQQAGSPEATVQSYVTAVFEGRDAVAYEYLDPDGRCRLDDLERQGQRTRTTRVVLRDSTIDGDDATVSIDLVHGSDAPLGTDEWKDAQTFRLRKGPNGWVIAGIPWPMYDCSNGEQ